MFWKIPSSVGCIGEGAFENCTSLSLVEYRRTQITNDGFIEEATGFAPSDIAYQRDGENKNLIPLEFAVACKDDWTNFETFKKVILKTWE